MAGHCRALRALTSRAGFVACRRIVDAAGKLPLWGVAYEVDVASGPIVHCHCAICRTAHGSAFSSVMPVPRERFRWVRGGKLLCSFESSPGKFRRFSSRCGSQIVAERPARPDVLLRLGCLDMPIADRPKAHIWRSDGATWFDPKDQLPEWPEFPRRS